ncbi:hypothetical protein [Prauserella alba]|uniref:DUF2244 domain-containing protein n=1 Tax=Prauserella alba TaxID=176898 RepID=A0ABN1V6J0_9PSEU|nr:hypothetical protein [Prauserella alba]MCP2183197.1 hypothetical protein [Prauserella alba]
MTEPVRVPAVPPAHRHGEIYRSVADPATGDRTAKLYLLLGVSELVVMGVLAFFMEPPVRWLLLAFGVAGCATFALVLYPRAKQVAGAAGDDLINVIVVPSGLITRGGLQLSWQDLSALRMDVTKNAGNQGRFAMHLSLQLTEGAAVKARTTTQAQRSGFVGTDRIRVTLGAAEEAELQRVRGLLEQACASAGVPFDYTERRT